MIKIRIREISFCLTMLALITLIGCSPKERSEFGIYLLSENMTTEKFQSIGLDELQLADQPVISTEDIISYDRSTHEIKLHKDAYQRIRDLYDLPVDVDGVPFVVALDHEPIYGGAFWTPASSLIFDGVTIMEPFESESTVIRLGLGYPTLEYASEIDPRGDVRIMEALEAAGKLR